MSDEYWVNDAIRRIRSKYGDKVQTKGKELNKFGANDLIGTSEATVMGLPAGVLAETYVATNAIDKISSSAGDTVVMGIEGHTISGGVFTFVAQDVTLQGQTETALTTPLARVTRAYNKGATDLSGTVYIYEDDAVTAGVPDTASKVHLIVAPAENQSLKAATTLSNVDYAIVTNIFSTVNKKTAAGAVIRFKVREVGGVFQTKFKLGINSLGARVEHSPRPMLIVPKNADVIITAEADGASTAIAAGFDSILATVI